MTVFPARKPLIAATETAIVPIQREPRHDLVVAPRTTPTEWARRRRADREARRIEAAGNRAAARIDHLGPAWHVVEWPRTDLATLLPNEVDGALRKERAGFLAIGPGGVFAVTVADHGRSRVLVAGDVVQINGKRPPYVAETRRDAKQAAKAMSRAVGLTVPVVPVLAFVGNGVISVYGLPKDCLVASHQDLDRLLIAGGARISARTAEKLSEVARHPTTWFNAPYQSAAERYRWYGAGEAVTDKAAIRG
jgi:hypothetical protein